MSQESQNNLFPVFLKLEKFRVLIVGGGKVGLEKVTAILANSPATQVRLVAGLICEPIHDLAAQYPNLRLEQRLFENSDLDNTDLIIIAINDKPTSQIIKQLANKTGMLANVADTPDQCDFYLGSVVQKGHIKIAISTNGKSPTIAKRLRETLEQNLPIKLNESIDNLVEFRKYLTGDFESKVKRLNAITSVLGPDTNKQPKPVYPLSIKQVFICIFSGFALLIFGYLLCYYLPPVSLWNYFFLMAGQIDSSILYYILAGFVAQLIDGALGMAYGITATSFLLSAGVGVAASSASVHASEVFTSGVSGLMHLKFGNVNKKLCKALIIPGVIGAVLGAYILTFLESYNHIIKPFVSTYTFILGAIIIYKALRKEGIRQKIKRLFPLAFFGGLMDSIGGGGWGPIVSSSLIAGGRNARFTIGSVNLAEFFVAVASSLTFFTIIGLTHWTIIFGLIIGGSIAAPIGAFLTGRMPTKTIMILVGLAVMILSLKRLFF